MKKKKKTEKFRAPIPANRWEGVDDDAEEEGSTAFTADGEERNGIEDRAANFNPFDDGKFEPDIS